MSRRKDRVTLVLAALVAVSGLVSCGSDAAPIEITERDGQALFERRALGDQAGCVTCHSRAEGVVLVGPPLYDLAASAAAAGRSDVRAYVRESIVAPGAYTVPGFEDAKPMPDNFAELLDEGQIDALVDHLTGAES